MKFADSDKKQKQPAARAAETALPASEPDIREPAVNPSPAARTAESGTETNVVQVGQGETSASALFDLYEKIAETNPGGQDAEIFEKVREWTFSDFSKPAHEFAGISQAELQGWQNRHRINLSAGRIRPDPIDLQRGFAWGHIRMAASANRLHSTLGPPSAHELGLGSPNPGEPS
jgi:hypothetical protein